MNISNIILILEQKIVSLNKFLSNASFNGDLSEINRLELEIEETQQTISTLRSILNNN
jgi:hypothetical protein